MWLFVQMWWPALFGIYAPDWMQAEPDNSPMMVANDNWRRLPHGGPIS